MGFNPDSYAKVVSAIANHQGSPISVPELSQLLGVKPTTLNARFRRHQIVVRTVGRTNYIPCELALQLAELHKYALLGWPTLQQASQLTRVKSGTIKARCEQGRVEGYLDLTKRIRINPTELERLPLDTRRKKPVEKSSPVGAELKLNGHSRPTTPLPVVRPSPAAIPIQILTSRDYGFPEPSTPRKPESNGAKPMPGPHPARPSGGLIYNPDHPFSISDCRVGKAIRYDNYEGTIIKLIDDPYNPQIQVKFPEHDHSLLREVLLIVGKRKTPIVP